jgi:hypothetical protein
MFSINQRHFFFKVNRVNREAGRFPSEVPGADGPPFVYGDARSGRLVYCG